MQPVRFGAELVKFRILQSICLPFIEPLKYSLLGTLVPEAIGIILRNDLSCADHVSYTVKMAWKALHFIMLILRKGNNNTKRLAYTSLLRPILEYGAACWDPYRKGQIR
jgi:hypothetical protein